MSFEESIHYAEDGENPNQRKRYQRKRRPSEFDPFKGFKPNKDGSGSGDEGDNFKMPDYPPPGIRGFLVATFILSALLFFVTRKSDELEIEFTEFVDEYLMAGKVSKMVVTGTTVVAHMKEDLKEAPRFFRIGGVDSFERRVEEAQAFVGLPRDDFVPIVYQKPSYIPTILIHLLPALILGFFSYSIYKRMNSASTKKNFMNFSGLTKADAITLDKKPQVRFKDVAGLGEAKTEIVEFVSFLKNPKKYQELGARIPKGALLVGPPGTGKTLLAKATAGEANVPFFSVAGSDFVEKFVGLGSLRVRDLFEKARKMAPCIIFIDEIDAIGKARSSSNFGNEERDNTLNQLLVEMDGFNTENSTVIVLAGTNRQDILDKALLRPGRFDRTISIDPPDKEGRKDIFKVHLAKLKTEKPPEEYADHLADLTPGFVGADIAGVCNEAALIASRMDKTSVDTKDFEDAIDRVVAGIERKSKVLDPVERNIVAHHEAGHAVTGWLLEHVDPLLKVSIIPRGASALGFAQYKNKDQYLYSREQLLDRMCMTLGGRVAEDIIFGNISTGAQDDLQKVTNLAFDQMAKYGFSEKIGLLSYHDSQQSEFSDRLFSEETAQMIDEEVRDLVNRAYERTYKLLLENKDKIEATAKRLLEKETIYYSDMEEILGARPFGDVKPQENK